MRPLALLSLTALLMLPGCPSSPPGDDDDATGDDDTIGDDDDSTGDDDDSSPSSCVWAPEVCNGEDDDCDGEIDEEGHDDGSACTVGDSCEDGVPTPGVPLACDDGFACNGTELCDPGFGCYGTDVPPASDGLECPVGVVMGAGSYAVAPPSHEGDTPTDMLTRELYVTPEVAAEGRPLPSNQWWTDVLVSELGGNLWAFPLVVNPEREGLEIGYPLDWNEGGTELISTPRLELRGTPLGGDEEDADVIVADFEGEDFGDWTTTGSAFGEAPTSGTLPGQSPVGGWLDDGFANGFHGGDGPTGTLTSPAFPLTRQWLHVLVSGGNHPPDDEGGRACVEVWPEGAVGDGEPLWWATGTNSESFSWNSWEVPAGLVGTSVQVRAIDEHSGGWGHVNMDHLFLSDYAEPAAVAGSGFTAADARVSGWGDWSVGVRLEDLEGRRMDFELARGVPFVWVELTDVSPLIGPADNIQLLNSAGAPLPIPSVTDRAVVRLEDRHFGIYAPEDSTFTLAETGELEVLTPDDEAWLVVAALPSPEELDAYAPYAWNVVRDTRFEWEWDTAAGQVDTTWTVDVEPLRGSGSETLQGWLPHHVNDTTHDLSTALFFETGVPYATPRGALRVAAGAAFDISWPFRGLVPGLPSPEEPAPGTPNAYDESRADYHVDQYSYTTGYGGDTYWGGKDIGRMGRYLWMALERGLTTEATRLTNSLRRALTDWLTYEDGETEHYYAAYPSWGGLVGFNESYGSSQFTDNHFHYGYLTVASAMLGAADPGFLEEYGPMASMVARQYANWERDHEMFPRLRTYDIWEGHSWAGGLSSGGGNNQESSSEAIQAWGGIYLLGAMLGDDEMRDTGAMGWAIESSAMREYWMDVRGENLPEAYDHDVVGILFAWGPAYATYFSGDPGWIYGIQWLPISPLLEHLQIDEGVAESQYTSMMTAREASLDGGDNSIAGMGTSLGNIVLGMQSLFDPAAAASELDALWSAGHPVATDAYTGGISYWQAHARRTLGQRVFDGWTDEPTSAIYEQEDGTRTVVIYNPSDEGRMVTVFGEAGEAVGRVATLPGNTATSDLLPAEAEGGTTVVRTSPADGEMAASRFLEQIDIVFDRDVDPAFAGLARLSGPGIAGSGVTLDLVSGPWARYQIDGVVVPETSYTLTIPTEPVQTTASFFIEAQPPLEVEWSSPFHTQTGVSLDTEVLELSFNARLDPTTLGEATMEGPDGTTVLELADGAALGDTTITLPLPPLVQEEIYTIRIAPGLTDVTDQTLFDELVITFSSAPAPFPPVLYGEAFAGWGFDIPGGVFVDTGVLDAHTGTFAMTISNPTSGTPVDTGDGPSIGMYVDPPADLSDYSSISYWIKTTGQVSSWNAVGDPDENPTMVWSGGLGTEWTRVEVALPADRDAVSRVLVISVSPGQTLTVDDIQVHP